MTNQDVEFWVRWMDGETTAKAIRKVPDDVMALVEDRDLVRQHHEPTPHWVVTEAGREFMDEHLTAD